MFHGLPARLFLRRFMVIGRSHRIKLTNPQWIAQQSASTLLLGRRTRMTLQRRMRTLLPLSRGSFLLLMPVTELLLFFPLLLLVSLLHGSNRLGQWMGPLLRGLPLRRLSTASSGLLRCTSFRLGSSLLFPNSRRGFRLIASGIRRSERTESIGVLRLRLPRSGIRHRPPRRFLPDQRLRHHLLVQMSTSLRLSLLKRARHWGWRP